MNQTKQTILHDATDTVGASVQLQPRNKSIDVILALLACVFMAIYYNGMRALFLTVWGVLFAVGIEWVCARVFRQPHQKGDLSAVITGIIIPLLLPATVSYFVVFTAVAVAIVVAKFPFGGYGHNLFNPAAVGTAFVTLCWPMAVLRYPEPFATVSGTAVVAGSSVAASLQAGGVPALPFLEGWMGHCAGPMGTTAILVIVACAVFLCVRKTISIITPISVLATVILCAMVFPRVNTNLVDSVVFELFAEVLVFGAVFMATDPITSPKSKAGRAVYGILLGLFIVFFRHFGQIELAFVFALLLANAFVEVCDQFGARITIQYKRNIRRYYRLFYRMGHAYLKNKWGDRYEALLTKETTYEQAPQQGGSCDE